MLLNEKRFAEQGLSPEEAFDQATRYVNNKVAKSVDIKGKPQASPEALDRLMKKPELSGDFEKMYGWSPISYTLDDDLRSR
jgi:hypothetical protein